MKKGVWIFQLCFKRCCLNFPVIKKFLYTMYIKRLVSDFIASCLFLIPSTSNRIILRLANILLAPARPVPRRRVRAVSIRKVNLASQGKVTRSKRARNQVHDVRKRSHDVEQLSREVSIDGIIQKARQTLHTRRQIERAKHKALIRTRATQRRQRIQIDIQNPTNRLDHRHRRAAPVPPRLRNPLRHVRVRQLRIVPRALAIRLGAVEGGDGGLVGDAAGAERAVAHEAWDEVVRAHDDGGAGHVEVELRVGGLRRGVAACEVFFDGRHAVGAVARVEGALVQLLEEGRLEGDVVAGEVEVGAGGGGVAFVELAWGMWVLDVGVVGGREAGLTVAGDAGWCAEDVVQRAVQEADAVVRAADAHLLRQDVAAVDVAADCEQCSQIGPHVEQGLCAFNELADGGNAIAGDVAVVGESVQAGARAALVGVSRSLERIIICGPGSMSALGGRVSAKERTFGETLVAFDSVVSWDEAEYRVDQCLDSTAKKSRNAVDKTGPELAGSVNNRFGSAAAGSVLLHAPLNLLSGNRVAEEGVHAICLKPRECKRGWRKERGKSEGVQHCERVNAATTQLIAI